MLTEDQYQEIKTRYLKTIVKATEEAGGLPGHLALFATEKDDPDAKETIVFMKIDDTFLSTEFGKDVFVEKMIPIMANDINKTFNVHSVAWSSEAWLRETKLDQVIPDNYKELPIKKEVIIVNIESLDKTECVMYDVLRNGHQVNADGDFTETVVLELMTETDQMINASGRFTGLIKHFIKS